MKKKPEKTWHIEAGYELRLLPTGAWGIYEGGQEKEIRLTLEAARTKARLMRKSRNEQAKTITA